MSNKDVFYQNLFARLPAKLSSDSDLLLFLLAVVCRCCCSLLAVVLVVIAVINMAAVVIMMIVIIIIDSFAHLTVIGARKTSIVVSIKQQQIAYLCSLSLSLNQVT